MAFDIHQKIVNRYGELDEKKAMQYRDQLFNLFVESPEGQALIDEGNGPSWADMMMDYGINYLAVTPPQMTPGDLSEVLFDLIPQKVSAEADEAPNIIHELQAFWKFLQREFQLENAAACLKILDDKAVRRLQKEMSNPANFGMAKSFVMMGKQRGFDMTTEEGINEWMKTYNAELAAGTGPRIPPPFPAFSGFASGGARKVQGKSRRRMERDSRKKNRRK